MFSASCGPDLNDVREGAVASVGRCASQGKCTIVVFRCLQQSITTPGRHPANMTSPSAPSAITAPPGHGTTFVAVLVSLLWVGVAVCALGTTMAMPAVLAAIACLSLTLWLCHERRRLGRALDESQQAGATLAAHAALVEVALANDVDEVLARSAALLGATRAWLRIEAEDGAPLHRWPAGAIDSDDSAPAWQEVSADDDIWLSPSGAPARGAALIRQDGMKLGLLCFEAEGQRRAWGAREAGLLWALAALVRQMLLRRRLERALADATAQNALERRRFLSHLSHKLRTPMTAVLGFAQILDLDQSLTPEHREFVREIDAAGKALLAMLNEVVGVPRE